MNESTAVVWAVRSFGCESVAYRGKHASKVPSDTEFYQVATGLPLPV
jgi:hypothetical protein